MKKVFLMFITIATTVNAHSQNFWEPTSWPSGFVSAIGTTAGYLFAGAYVVAGNNVSIPIYRSSDNSATWTYCFALPEPGGGEYYDFCFARGNNNDVYLGYNWESGGAIYRSTDNGDTWVELGNRNPSGVNAITINRDNDIFLASDLGVERSTDNGGSWIVFQVSGPRRSIAVNDMGYVFAGGGLSDGVYRSTDNGETWTQTGLNFGNVASLLADKHLLFGGTTAGLFRSTNNGDTWNQVLSTNNLSRKALCVNASGHVFVGRWGGGVLRSNNHGDTWAQLNGGLTDLRITSLAINDNGRIFAGAPSGIFRSVESTVGVETTEGIPASFKLEQNYPNPFNPSTTISYQLPLQSHVTLKVFDALGREVASLVNETKKPGNYEVTWDANGLASGVYICRLTANGYSETRKLMLIK